MRACFFSFMIEGSEKSHLWRSYISTINLYPSWLMNLAKGKEIMNFHMILSAKSVLEDFTLKAMRNFGAAVNTCVGGMAKRAKKVSIFCWQSMLG